MIDLTNPEIISAFIQASGIIIAAIITAFFAKNIVKESVKPFFQSYSDKTHELQNITQKATNDIFIVTAMGDNLLKKYLPEFRQKLDMGIRFRYLLLDQDGYQKLDVYMHGKPSDGNEYFQTLEKLFKLQAEYPNLVEIRTFHGFMSASYIGIDMCPETRPLHILSSSIIQVMIYQYRTSAKISPISYISPKSEEKQYRSTVSSICEMWKDATPISDTPKE